MDWDHIFGELGVRWFHTGGIYAALSETTAALTVEAVEAHEWEFHESRKYDNLEILEILDRVGGGARVVR